MVNVKIVQGELKGGEATTESGFKYYEFLGIPYAKPPVGELRFKSPQSPEPWEGIRDATSVDSNVMSCQIDILTGKTSGSEDCLYLNVYTPQVPTSYDNLKPVMVHCHGGGFVTGSGVIKKLGGPDFLVQKDVVMVSFNYRLGPLGFLSLDIPEAAGNMGLKDQVKALQWVQNNIDKFGGDKNNVTIFGISAGSASCEYLMLSSLTKGLFHKCILQSGSTLNHWTINYPGTSKTLTFKLAQKFGYMGPESDIKALFKVLFEAPALELTKYAYNIADNNNPNSLSFGFVPVIERDFENGDAFLTDYPYTLLKNGKYNKVPVIRGFCNVEGSLTSAMKPHIIKDLITNESFTDFWTYKLDTGDVMKYNQKLVSAYIKNAGNDNSTKQFAVDFIGDLDFGAGIQIAGKLQSSEIPVYMYHFCYDGNINLCKVLFGMSYNGAGHGDDTGYFLRHELLDQRSANDSDLLMRERLTKMWTNFAKTSNPTPEDYTEAEVQWPVYTQETKQYLHIDSKCEVKADLQPEKLAIFEEIYDKYKK